MSKTKASDIEKTEATSVFSISEVLVKVLDGCAINHRFWVFAATTTNVAYVLRVTDTETGQVREYENPLGKPADAITDTAAFATCR